MNGRKPKANRLVTKEGQDELQGTGIEDTWFQDLTLKQQLCSPSGRHTKDQRSTKIAKCFE